MQDLTSGPVVLGSHFEKVFIDVRIFNPNVASYQNLQPETCLKRHEQKKRCQYDQRVREVEHTSFFPLVFTTSGRMGRSTMIVYKSLAHLLSVKRDKSYKHVICWLRCRLAFALLRSAIMCLRGSRSLNTCNDCHHQSLNVLWRDMYLLSELTYRFLIFYSIIKLSLLFVHCKF